MRNLRVQVYEVFLCTPQGNGRPPVLNASPLITCGSSAHDWLLFLGWIGVVVYTAGIPVLVLYLLSPLTGAYKDQQQYSRHNRAQLGYLYVKYTREHWFWEVVIMLRKVRCSGLRGTWRAEVVRHANAAFDCYDPNVPLFARVLPAAGEFMLLPYVSP